MLKLSSAGEKSFTVEEFLPIFSQTRKDKDQGVFEDFVECLKLYDKQENGTMLGAELLHILLSLGKCLSLSIFNTDYYFSNCRHICLNCLET